MFNLFSKKKPITDKQISDEMVAVTSLLLEAANIDEEFGENEKKVIFSIIKKQFSIDDDKLIMKTITEVQENINSSGDLVAHTRKIKNNWTQKKRIEIIEMLWNVCLIDNNLDPYEDMLIRKIAGLLYVSTKDSNDAKNKVLQSLDK